MHAGQIRHRTIVMIRLWGLFESRRVWQHNISGIWLVPLNPRSICGKVKLKAKSGNWRGCNAGNSQPHKCAAMLGADKGGPAMLNEIIFLLSSPEQFVCVYRDGEIYIEPDGAAG